MPSFEEIGRDYAVRVRSAIQLDKNLGQEYVKKAFVSERVTERSLAETKLVEVLKKIAEELETRWTVKDKPLTDEQKEEILRQAGIELGLANPREFIYITKGASNDAYMQLVTHISSLVPATGKK